MFLTVGLAVGPIAGWEAAPSVDVPSDLAVAEFAADQNIGIDEARKRLDRREDLRPVVAQIAASHPESYAGTEILHQPEFRIVVHFVGTVPAEARSEFESMGDVELRGDAQMSEVAAARMTEALTRTLSAKSDIADFGVWTDPRSGSTEIAIQLAPGALPDDVNLPVGLVGDRPHVEFVETPITELAANVYGGGKSNICTLAFTADRYGTSGILGAGHGTCPNATTYYYHSGASASMSLMAYYVGYYGDFSFFAVNGTEVDDYYWDTGQFTDVGSEVWDVWYGDYVCHWGLSSGRSCDYVGGWNYCSGNVCKRVWVMNDISASGDSGGPWYMGIDKSQALGVHRGVSYISGKSRSIFSMTRYARNAIAAAIKTN